MSTQDKVILKAIIEACNSEDKPYMKIDTIMSYTSQLKDERARNGIFQITGLNPSIYDDIELVEMVKDLTEIILLRRSRPKTYAVNFKFILFKKPFRIRF